LSDTPIFELPLVHPFLGPGEWLGCFVVGCDESRQSAAASCSRCAAEPPTSSAIERVLRPSAASNTIRARFTSRCGVLGARQRASSTLRIFGLSRTSLASRTHPNLES
jgi:hypothetical protein